jgi:hypothetical protein
VLNTQTLSSFQSGVYLAWNVTGSVTIQVTNLNPNANAILNGLFLGAVTTPTASATFVGADTTTQGNWKGTYGNAGYDISQDPSANDPTLPSNVSVSFGSHLNYTWTTTSSDPRALQEAAPNSTNRIAAVWWSPASFSINVTANGPTSYALALYALDFDGIGGGRDEQIQLISDDSGQVLDTETLSSFQNGVYLVWNVTGSVTIQVTNLNPNSNAIVNGLFVN